MRGTRKRRRAVAHNVAADLDIGTPPLTAKPRIFAGAVATSCLPLRHIGVVDQVTDYSSFGLVHLKRKEKCLALEGFGRLLCPFRGIGLFVAVPDQRPMLCQSRHKPIGKG